MKRLQNPAGDLIFLPGFSLFFSQIPIISYLYSFSASLFKICFYSFTQDLCKERSWTYYRLAKEADIPYSTLNNMVNRTNIPTIPTLQKLCDAFGITLADFFLDEPDALQLTEGQQEIITLYNNLSLEKKKILKAYMKGLLMEV